MLILYYDMITCVHDFKKSHMHVNGLNPGLHLLRLLSVDPSTLYSLTGSLVIYSVTDNITDSTTVLTTTENLLRLYIH